MRVGRESSRRTWRTQFELIWTLSRLCFRVRAMAGLPRVEKNSLTSSALSSEESCTDNIFQNLRLKSMGLLVDGGTRNNSLPGKRRG